MINNKTISPATPRLSAAEQAGCTRPDNENINVVWGVPRRQNEILVQLEAQLAGSREIIQSGSLKVELFAFKARQLQHDHKIANFLARGHMAHGEGDIGAGLCQIEQCQPHRE